MRHACQQDSASKGLTQAEVATVFAHVGRIIANFKALRAAEAAVAEPAKIRRPARRARA